MNRYPLLKKVRLRTFSKAVKPVAVSIRFFTRSKSSNLSKKDIVEGEV